jgi:hypothetical protein
MAAAKKRQSALEDVALVAGTQQNLSNLYSFDIYDVNNVRYAHAQISKDLRSTMGELKRGSFRES